MEHKIVCKVRFIKEKEEREFTWSDGAATFQPYTLGKMQCDGFERHTRQARMCLQDLADLHRQPKGRAAIGQKCLELATAGFHLYNLIFDEQGTAKDVRRWLQGITRDAEGVETLEIVSESQPWFVPWNVVYDRNPHREVFPDPVVAPDRYQPFWGIQYNLCGGLTVDPLRQMRFPCAPHVLLVLDPEVLESLRGYPDPGGRKPNQERLLLDFLEEHGLTENRVGTRAQLADALAERRPQMIYWLGHARPDALYLGAEKITLPELGDFLRAICNDGESSGGLVFLNACTTAQAGDLGSFLEAFHKAGYSGLIATESQTIDTFANPFGLAILDGFLYQGHPIGGLLSGLRQGNLPLGLLYGTYMAPNLKVPPPTKSKPDDTEPAPVSPTVPTDRTGTTLQKDESPPSPTALPLPAKPYLPLSPFGPEHRALFAGRDEDVVRFASLLGDGVTRILVLHGESGVGKSSFLRAGVIPYLEGDCIGYRFLRDSAAGPDQGVTSSVMFIRSTNDLAGQLAGVLSRFSVSPLRYRNPAGRDVEVDLPDLVARIVGSATPVEPPALRAALLADRSLASRILDRMARELAKTMVLVIDQAEEIFTLHQGPEDASRAWALEALGRLAAGSGDYKVIVSMRTEYLGSSRVDLQACKLEYSIVSPK